MNYNIFDFLNINAVRRGKLPSWMNSCLEKETNRDIFEAILEAIALGWQTPQI